MEDKEVFDIVDEDNKVIGKATRKETHTKGYIHRSVFFFLLNSGHKVFVNQRTENKEFYPEYWSIVFGGHVHSEETYEQAVKRESVEEIGIKEIPILISSYKKRFDYLDKENVNIYAFITDETPIIETKEIKQGRFVDIKEIEKMTTKEKFLPETKFLYNVLKAYLLKIKNS